MQCCQQCGMLQPHCLQCGMLQPHCLQCFAKDRVIAPHVRFS